MTMFQYPVPVNQGLRDMKPTAFTAATKIGLVCIVVLSLSGCSNHGSPKLVPIQGSVTLDGVPLTDASVNFVSQANNASLGGANIKDGAFQVRLPAGAYKVQILASRPVPGSSVPDMGGAPVLQSIIPARYNSATSLTADVADGHAPLSFSLMSK
jgi:hypothetical protein